MIGVRTNHPESNKMESNTLFIRSNQQLIDDTKKQYDNAKVSLSLSCDWYNDDPTDDQVTVHHFQSMMEVKRLHLLLKNLHPDYFRKGEFVIIGEYENDDQEIHPVFWCSRSISWSFNSDYATPYYCWKDAEIAIDNEAVRCHIVASTPVPLVLRSNKGSTEIVVKNIRVISAQASDPY